MRLAVGLCVAAVLLTTVQVMAGDDEPAAVDPAAAAEETKTEAKPEAEPEAEQAAEAKPEAEQAAEAKPEAKPEAEREAAKSADLDVPAWLTERTVAEPAMDVLYSVTADDERWYHVLDQPVKMDVSGADPLVRGMLESMGLPAGGVTELRAQPVVRHLVTHPGATGTQMRFGVAVLGAALTCQLVGTVMVHVHFAMVFAVRDVADVPSVRVCMSHVQRATAGYVDKLSYFGQPFAFFVELNRAFNATFAAHDDRPDDTDLSRLVDDLQEVRRQAKVLLDERCGGASDPDRVVRTVRVKQYTDKVFTDRTAVDHQQLLAMIETLDDYAFVDFGTMGVEFWTEWFEIKHYEMPKHEGEDELTAG